MSPYGDVSTGVPSRMPILSAAWGVVLAFALSNSATPLYVRWQAMLHFSSGILTDVFAAYIVGLLMTLLIIGQFSDHYGRKAVLIPGTLFAMLACLLLMYAQSLIGLLIARFFTGIYVGIISSAGIAAVVDLGGRSYRKQASLIASIAMVVGAALGPILAGILSVYQMHPVFEVYGILGLMFLTFFLLLIKLPLNGTSCLVSPTSSFRWRLPNVSAKYRRFIGVGIAVFGPGLTATCFVLSLGPSLLATLLQVDSPLISGSIAGVMFIAAIVVQCVFKHFALKTILLMGTLCTCCSMISLNIAVHTAVLWPLILAAILAGPGQGLGQLGGLMLIAFNVPETHRAEANALMNMGSYVLAGILPVMAGYLTDVTSLTTGATVFTIVLLIMAMIGGYYVVSALKRPFLIPSSVAE